MTQPIDKDGEDLVEALFLEARQNTPHVPPALMDRVLSDAEGLLPAGPTPRKAKARWRVRIGQQFGLIGAVGGLAAAAVVGFAIGINPPDALNDVALPAVFMPEAVLFDDSAEAFGFGWDLGEI